MSYLVMGNWKLNGSKTMVQEVLSKLAANNQHSSIDIAIAPPTMYLDLAERTVAGSSVALGAQNVDLENSGAFTGDVSAAMLADFNAKYIIIGHSERRAYHHESNEFIADKFAFLKENNLVPVLCIGETLEQFEKGESKAVCAAQLDAVVKKVGIEAFVGAVVAYEPIWAIGTGKSATPQQAQDIHAFIRSHLATYNADVAAKVTILYGGSVNQNNAFELFGQPDINGALVGGASLKADAFQGIIDAAVQVQQGE